ncbi:MAG: 4-hydroxythreonine-4-phosphate dehydrogenase PdxA [Candidatus Methylomirabilia bacterium]
MKPILGITMGDPSGVGPEIVVKALASPRLWRVCRPLVFGRLPVMAAAARASGGGIGFVPVGDTLPPPTRARCPLFETGPERDRVPPFGHASAAGGRAALEAVTGAICLALDGRVDAIVTAPISKEAIRAAGSPFPGHTEMLASLTKAKRHAMMLVGGPLRVSLATIHVPLAQVPALITARKVREVIELTWEAVRLFGLRRPRIAVCGLNPHAGEAGIMGDEERRVIAPAVRAMANKGVPVSGPYPADTIFFRAARGEFAAVVAMYHDQGLGPLKTLAFDTGVNLTLGLPIIRTSVDHGTAFDIAGKGVASAESLLAAIELAATMARRRRS